MKWSLFNWKKPAVSSGEPEDYQVVKNTVSQNERNITNINSQITNVNNQLNNTVTVNTNQTITGQKTINAQTTISANPTPLILKANNNEKTYLVFRDNQNNSNFSLGANADGTSFEMNRGHLTIKTLQDNKNVAFERVSRLKLNQTVLEAGTEINAGFGGGTVKFIPEDNSTKTLQFFNNNATDQRRFNLLVPEPTQANNPATKQYVDTKETAINNQITAINNRIVENNTILKRVYTFTPTSSTPVEYGSIYRYNLTITDLTNVSVLGISVDFKSQSGASQKALFWANTYSLGFNTINNTQYLGIQLIGNKVLYDNLRQLGLNLNIDFTQFEITVFYMSTSNREAEQTYQGRIVPLTEIFGGNNEN